MNRFHLMVLHRMTGMTWQSSARLVALACWATAVALTAGMGWHAWTFMHDTAPGPRYVTSQVDSAVTPLQMGGLDSMTGIEKRIAP